MESLLLAKVPGLGFRMWWTLSATPAHTLQDPATVLPEGLWFFCDTACLPPRRSRNYASHNRSEVLALSKGRFSLLSTSLRKLKTNK